MQSSEDLLSRIELLNKKIREKKIGSSKMMVGSLDVEALYPSIDVRKAGEICGDRILETELKQDGIDYRWARHAESRDHAIIGRGKNFRMRKLFWRFTALYCAEN